MIHNFTSIERYTIYNEGMGLRKYHLHQQFHLKSQYTWNSRVNHVFLRPNFIHMSFKHFILVIVIYIMLVDSPKTMPHSCRILQKYTIFRIRHTPVDILEEYEQHRFILISTQFSKYYLYFNLLSYFEKKKNSIFFTLFCNTSVSTFHDVFKTQNIENSLIHSTYLQFKHHSIQTQYRQKALGDSNILFEPRWTELFDTFCST